MMTNREWLMERMQNMSDEELGKKMSNHDNVYLEPDIVNWLKQEHKEKPKLSEAERVILENVPKKYKWIVRDRDGDVKAYGDKPIKDEEDGLWFNIGANLDYLCCFNHLFQFITWSDNEPYEISELLKGE